MNRHGLLRSRLPLVAVASVAALVASAATNFAAADAPAAPGTGGTAAQARAGSKHHLSAAGHIAYPRISGKRQGGTGEPGSGTPAGVPANGRYAFLLKLNTTATMAAYRSAVPQGKTAASSAARSQFQRVQVAQNAVVAALPAGSKVLYKTHSVLAGVAVVTDVHNLAALGAISNVAAVYPIAPKHASNAYAVPLQGAPQVWSAYGDQGQNSTVAVIDTGIDYTHANFGGPGTKAAYDAELANDGSASPNFPTAKVIRGYDFAGDNYDADPGSPTFQPVPHPDPNPLDCAGHGSHVAGIAAGYGVTAPGATFTGDYATLTSGDIAAMRIGPGMAPRAKLLAYKVFGCDGSTNLVGQAIDAASDPNGDGDPSDHAKVINMSLGSDFGSPQDADSVASGAASLLGISVVVAAGNGGDYYDIDGSPGNAPSTIEVANSVDAFDRYDALHVTAPPSIAGDKGAERSTSYDWQTKPDLAGTVINLTDPTNLDGCDPLSAADAARVSGKVAFLEWNSDDTTRRCGSVARSGNVAAAGAIGFVFGDDEQTFSGGIIGSTAIPGVMVVKSAADEIRTELLANHAVTVNGTTANGFDQLITANNDKVNDSSSRGIRGNGNMKPDVTAVGTSVFSTAVGTGNDGVSFSGTSMATPMVAGLSALVRSAHPDWTPEEVKADIMNTAGQDLYTGANHTGSVFAPNRVGSGRIQAKRALDNQVLAYVTDNPGVVSVSFGTIEATAPVTFSKKVKVANKGLTPVTFSASYDALTAVPGVNYSVSPSSLTIDELSSKTVTVTVSIPNPTLLTKTHDPTLALTQGGLPREFLADASGRLLLTPTSGSSTQLRVPVYSAPRPASVMTQPSSLTLPSTAPVQTASLPLSGLGVDQGSGDQSVVSTVAGFELQAISGRAPTCTAALTFGCVHFPDERSADLKYVAVTSDAPQVASLGGNKINDSLTYFAITAQGRWRTPAPAQEFDILIDTTGDNKPDFVLYNTRLRGQDIFVSNLLDLNAGTIVDVEAIDNRLGNTDAALFDSDTMVLPVANAALGLTSAHPRIRYGVASYSNASGDAVDTVGLNPANGNLLHPLTIDVTRPAVAVFGAFSASTDLEFFQDAPGTTLTVRKDTPAYAQDKPLGALLVHLHNKTGAKAQRVALKNASNVSLTLSRATAPLHTTVNATITVTNTAGAPATGTVVLRRVGGGGATVTGNLVNGQVVLHVAPPSRGAWMMRAEYAGDANYLAGHSPTRVLIVT